ncbi:glucose/arabinose dehydrogenase [Nonlabens dokdonensis]|uniref:Glucose/sorbosone dehydrogenase n=2 Tax=Nonlabens dokdonensis TaxID=328515 RepID=L7WF77_NONDD|nr:PQQ-dependent sugar dehydrogenase [Nonlabens dokdonensis]AGC78601.1 glucose/sorbosone dehydrogenase [Nonlabens dokdonensis DSW-6]PZX39270.1 glucose/arabinose dehydrogenase [Nonlabens dokdonensis]
MIRFTLIICFSLILISCKNDSKSIDNLAVNDSSPILESNDKSNQSKPAVQNIPLIEDQKDYTVTTVVKDLTNPWGMTWLPNGDVIYTEKAGEMYRFDGTTSNEISGVPEVYLRGQGGLLDVTIHPNYKENNKIYISYASSEGEGSGGNTAIASAVLKNDELTDLKVLYKATPNTRKGQHFGSRFAWDSEGYLYFSIGERGERDVNPQDLTRDGGKIYRIHDDGRIPEDNPFVDVTGAKTAAFTYGNRNPQGMTVHPRTGEIIAHEHGPQGGDEINFIKAGRNYGWPVISYGENYGGGEFAESTAKEGMEQPFYYWVPSIAPSGFAIIDNEAYKNWNGNYLVGSLKFQYLEMLYVNDKGVSKREKLVDGLGRMRNVKIGPDGMIYIGVEGKGIFKITR